MNFFRFGTRFVSALSRVHFVIPAAFQYGYYLPPDRYTGDQVPYQNMNITHTVDVKGARSVQIIEDIGDAKQRILSQPCLRVFMTCGKIILPLLFD